MPTLLIFFMGAYCVLGTFTQIEIKSVAEDNVTLPCQHRLGLLGEKSLDIEWLSNMSGSQQPQLISYSGGQVYEHNENRKGRYSFVSNYLAGDASILIRSLEPSDAGQYICKVKNGGQFEWYYILLKVLVKPSEPKCWSTGKQLEGTNVTLHCLSSAGTEPIMYRWLRVNPKDDVTGLLQNSARLESPNRLVLENLSKNDNGSYRCMVSNEAGKRICDVHVKVMVASNIGFLAGVVSGVVVGVFLIFLALWLLLRRKETKKKEEDEFLNEIREDAEAPKARLMKPGSSSSGSRSSHSGSLSTRSTTNSASRSQQTISTQETPHREPRHCLEQI
ncbi:CXADR-like membrane protein [Bombina bombina]|uniref:CXADR-like membrane protein n=1 Tax=Bombina bombina TaxID=8345 RepID=UPI00235AD379|nr:CXADR-like membrane protein [Bombina bombina]